MPAVIIALCLAAVGVWRYVRRAPMHPRRRVVSEATGVPVVAIDDYAPRRFARGSAPPPLTAPHLVSRMNLAALANRPGERLLRRVSTPAPVDGRWDSIGRVRRRRQSASSPRVGAVSSRP